MTDIYRSIEYPEYFIIITEDNKRYEVGRNFITKRDSTPWRHPDCFWGHPMEKYYPRSNELALLVIHGHTVDSLRVVAREGVKMELECEDL